MAEKYYDKKINAATTWGGDSSTGGLKVKGGRVQEWIKEAIAALENTSSSLSERLDTDEGQLSSMLGSVLKNTPAVFNGFVNNVTPMGQFTSNPDGVVFDTKWNTFLAYNDTGSQRIYCSDFSEKIKYCATSNPNSPYSGKLYIYDGEAYAWNGSALTPITDVIVAALKSGDVVPMFSQDIESWSERNATIEDSFEGSVRTTAGDESIDSGKAARLVSIVAKKDFTATKLKATGFNLLHGATAVGGGYYFLVPKLTFGTWGTTDENNGVLFTKNDSTNLTPTVRFKPIADGVPANVNDGSVCAYTDAGGLRFYTTSGAGYLIVSGITLANTCAHIAWSRRYDEFISPTSSYDGGSEVALTAIINACHSYGLLLTAESGLGVVADGIDFGDTQATWTRRVERTKPTWETVNNGDGTYTHTATISGMKEGGIAECGDLQLEVALNVVSYTDKKSAATEDYVKYELAATATGTVSISPEYNVEDWGLEEFVGASGEAEVTVRYAQGFPDAVAALVALRSVIEASIGGNEARVSNVEKAIIALDGAGTAAGMREVPTLCGQPMKLYAAGTPAEALVPDNWIGLADGGYAWTGTPTAIGQEYIDTLNGGKYEAVWNNYEQRTLKWLEV